MKVLSPFRRQVKLSICLAANYIIFIFRMKFEFSFETRIILIILLQVGGTILAAKLAKERGWAINVGGGFHHCCSGRGGGFCAYADISLCIHFAFVRLNISR